MYPPIAREQEILHCNLIDLKPSDRKQWNIKFPYQDTLPSRSESKTYHLVSVKSIVDMRFLMARLSKRFEGWGYLEQIENIWAPILRCTQHTRLPLGSESQLCDALSQYDIRTSVVIQPMSYLVKVEARQTDRKDCSSMIIPQYSETIGQKAKHMDKIALAL